MWKLINNSNFNLVMRCKYDFKSTLSRNNKHVAVFMFIGTLYEVNVILVPVCNWYNTII